MTEWTPQFDVSRVCRCAYTWGMDGAVPNSIHPACPLHGESAEQKLVCEVELFLAERRG